MMMVTRILGIISGLFLVVAAAALWRPQWLGADFAASLSAIEGYRSILAATVVICGGAIAIAAALPVGPEAISSRRTPLKAGSSGSRAHLVLASDYPPNQSPQAQTWQSAAALAAGRIAASVAAAESAAAPPIKRHADDELARLNTFQSEANSTTANVYLVHQVG